MKDKGWGVKDKSGEETYCHSMAEEREGND